MVVGIAVLSTTEEPDSAVMGWLGRGESGKERRKKEGYIKLKASPGFNNNINKRCGLTMTVTHSLLDQWSSIAMLHNRESDYCYDDDCYGKNFKNKHNRMSIFFRCQEESSLHDGYPDSYDSM